MLPPSPRCRHYTERCVLPSVRLLAAVTALLLQLPRHVPVQGGGLVTVDPVLAGWRHGTKRGPGPRWLIVLLKSSPTIFLYLHFRVHHRQQGDLALKEEDLVTVNPTLAGWRHSTKRGRGPRWLIVLLISTLQCSCRHGAAWGRGPAGLQYYIDGGIFTSALCTCPPSPARRLGTARGRGHTSGPRNGRLASWYETGSVGPGVHCITGILVLLVYIRYYLCCPTINCWWYLHLRVHQQQPGDLALQVVNCVKQWASLWQAAAMVRNGGGGPAG